MRRILVCLMMTPAATAGVSAQSLEQRVATVDSGKVRLSFAARPGVCGTGNGITLHHDSDEWESDCDDRLVRVALRVVDHRVVGLRTYVGGRWRSGVATVDLGTVRPQEAATYLIGIAERQKELDGDPILPAALADSVVVWPSLLRIARSSTTSPEIQRTAIFWIGQAAGARVGPALDSIVGDPRGNREVRKQAVFALSQRDRNEGVPALIRIARTNPDPELRKTALFWLGQSEDPRAVDLFEEILR